MMRKITAMLLIVVLMLVMTAPALAAGVTWDQDYNNQTYTFTLTCTETRCTANVQTMYSGNTVKSELVGYREKSQNARVKGPVQYHESFTYAVSNEAAGYFYAAEGDYYVGNTHLTNRYISK